MVTYFDVRCAISPYTRSGRKLVLGAPGVRHRASEIHQQHIHAAPADLDPIA